MISERLKAADVLQIYKLWNEYSDAINSGNIEQLTALWHTDGIEIPPNSPQCCGREQIMKFMQSQFDQFHKILSISPNVVRIHGNRAYTYGTFISRVMPKNNKERILTQRSGKFLTILEKRPDGCWKILIDCSNINIVDENDGGDFIVLSDQTLV